MDDCIFCKIIAGQIPSQKVFEDENLFCFRDINPQAPQHLLIVPKTHIAKLADLQPSDQAIMGKLIMTATKLAKDLGMDPQDYRLVINNGETAGQSVWHIHVHLLSGRPFHWPPG
jgi:histidine triad (HIT) family protein